jgi:hypothetical protein
MLSTDLDVLECRARIRCAERTPGRVRVNRDVRELTIADLATELCRTEMLMRARGSTLMGAASPVWLVERRARAARVRTWQSGEVEAGLVWLCSRGLCEAVGEAYAWTRNATDERVRRQTL